MAVNENPHGLWNSRRLGELPRGDQGTGVPRLSHRPDGPQVILSLAVDLGEQGLRVCCAELRSLDSLIVRLSERTEAHWKLRLVDLHWPQAIVKRRRRPNCGAPYPGGLLTLILFGDSEPAGGRGDQSVCQPLRGRDVDGVARCLSSFSILRDVPRRLDVAFGPAQYSHWTD